MNQVFLAGSTIDFSAITTALAESINAAQISALIGAVLAASTGLAVLWFGARKLTKSIVSAFKSGKIHF